MTEAKAVAVERELDGTVTEYFDVPIGQSSMKQGAPLGVEASR